MNHDNNNNPDALTASNSTIAEKRPRINEDD